MREKLDWLEARSKRRPVALSAAFCNGLLVTALLVQQTDLQNQLVEWCSRHLRDRVGQEVIHCKLLGAEPPADAGTCTPSPSGALLHGRLGRPNRHKLSDASCGVVPTLLHAARVNDLEFHSRECRGGVAKYQVFGS